MPALAPRAQHRRSFRDGSSQKPLRISTNTQVITNPSVSIGPADRLDISVIASINISNRRMKDNLPISVLACGGFLKDSRSTARLNRHTKPST
eukprot:448585-Hanusia_phi.AAC.3